MEKQIEELLDVMISKFPRKEYQPGEIALSLDSIKCADYARHGAPEAWELAKLIRQMPCGISSHYTWQTRIADELINVYASRK